MIRFIYIRSGEILTVVIMLAIVSYLVMSLDDSRAILDNENSALAAVREVFQMEKAEDQGYLPLSELRSRSVVLSRLKQTKLPHTRAEFFSDNKYFYLFLLERQTSGADDYISGTSRQLPSGFKILAWPSEYAVTGEMAFYIDQRGFLAYTANRRSQYDGWKKFPPDLRKPGQAVDLHMKNKTANNVHKVENVLWTVEAFEADG